MATILQTRNGTAAEWTIKNTLLAIGELGVENDTRKMKSGDGVTTWNSLPYMSGAATAAASAVSFNPTGSIAATNVQAAIAELDGEKASQVTGSVGRYAGMIAAGPPSVGTYLAGDWLQTQTGSGIWSCISGGSPGIWVSSHAPNDLQRGNIAQKKDWNMHYRYPGRVSATGLGFGAANRIIGAPYFIPEDVKLNQISFEILTGCHPNDTNAKLQFGVYSDHQGSPGELLWESAEINFSATATIGNTTVVITNAISGGQWVWLSARAKNIAFSSGTLRAMESSPYAVGSSVINSAYLDSSISLNGLLTDRGFGGQLPQRWPESALFNRATSLIPAYFLNFAADPDRNKSDRHNPDRFPVMLQRPELVGDACQEPCMWYDPRPATPADQKYVLFFSAGWVTQEYCWATAPSVDGPFTRRGYFGSGGRGNIYYENGVLYHYGSQNTGTPGGPVLCRFASGPEGLAAATPVNALIGTQGFPLGINFMNSCMIKRGTNDYVMLFENTDTGVDPGIWKAGLATGTSPQGPFTIQTWPLSSLMQTVTGHVGHWSAGSIVKVGSTYKQIYHAADKGNLPSEIFLATSTDLTNWTPLPRKVVGRKHPREWDQVADPWIFTDPAGLGKTYLFWSAVENDTETGCIMRSNPNKMDIAGLLGI